MGYMVHGQCYQTIAEAQDVAVSYMLTSVPMTGTQVASITANPPTYIITDLQTGAVSQYPLTINPPLCDFNAGVTLGVQLSSAIVSLLVVAAAWVLVRRASL